MNEMKGEKVKNMRNKGITLIALVITIIVLLILAAVSIATLTGENGILTRANESKTETEIGEEEEAIKLAYNGVMADNLGDGVTAEQLENELQANGYNATATGENPIVITFGAPSNRVYEIDANGNIAEAKLPVTLEQAKDNSMLTNDTDTKVTVSDGTVTVPAGFKVAEDSGSTLDEGIVITDAPDGEEGNEFVWVPVSQENFNTQFVRRAGYYNKNPQTLTTSYGEADGNSETGANTNTGVTESETTKAEVKLMYDSVYNNEGFYIGRYEVGRDSTDSNKVVIQKGANVYNNVAWSKNKTMNEESVVEGTESNPDGAIELARNFDTANEYKTVTSTLCYGVQWDATLTWIDPDYTGFAKDSSGMGWYSGVSENADHKTGIDLKEGDSVKNMTKKIYDLAGNVREWTMESYDTGYRVDRGGDYSGSGSNNPASCRSSNRPSGSPSNIGFRVTLYLNS